MDPIEGGIGLKKEETVERFYDIHGAVKIRLAGHDPVSDIIDRTLAFFSTTPGPADLNIIMGDYPGGSWTPIGNLVGDRYLYDPDANSTTVLGHRIAGKPSKLDVEYVIVGDLRQSRGPVTVYVPKPRRPLSPGRSFRYDLRDGSTGRALLGLLGNPFGFRNIVKQAERLTEAIIEPFFFAKLPEKGLSLVHAASVCEGESSTVLAGSANVGKSTFALSSAKKGKGFLGDSFVILSETGEVLPYPGLIKLHGGHLTLFPELEDRLAAGMGGLGASLLKRELLAQGGRAIDLLPQRQISELFDKVEIPKRTSMRRAIHVVRGSFAEARTNPIAPEQLARAMAADLFWEFEATQWRNAQFADAPSAYLGFDLTQRSVEHHNRVTAVLRNAVRNSDCHSVSLPFDAPVVGVEEMVPQSKSA